MVSIHAPAWGATDSSLRFAAMRFVSIHAPAWGATQMSAMIANAAKFQSTLPHGERLISLNVMSSSSKFQSTLPHGERQAALSLSSAFLLFQSTLPHGERLDFVRELRNVTKVSIHAPVWGATHFGILRQRNILCFNPRSRMGSDLLTVAPGDSIFSFNPRSRMGSDHKDSNRFFSQFVFQSTLPHGERLTTVLFLQYRRESFNPRSRMGSDCTFLIILFYNELQQCFCESAKCYYLYAIISTIQYLIS